MIMFPFFIPFSNNPSKIEFTKSFRIGLWVLLAVIIVFFGILFYLIYDSDSRIRLAISIDNKVFNELIDAQNKQILELIKETRKELK